MVIHNLKGYDGHLIVKSLKSQFGKMTVIPHNLEKYLFLSVGQLNFLDSFQFTPKSLEVLFKTLEDDEFKYLVGSCTTSHFGLVRLKGVYPYDYMDSFDRFGETSFPTQDAFFNKLTGSPCSDSDLQQDVLLMTDFFEKFRKTCFDFYSLDPLHYYTAPFLAWDAALRMSRVDLQLITDENTYNFVKNNIRGGISMISTRHANANNPTISDTYDSNIPNQNLIYLDANNLYGWAMSQFLPTNGFRFLSDDEITAQTGIFMK